MAAEAETGEEIEQLNLRDQQERLYCYLFAQKESFHNAVLLWFSRIVTASALAPVA